MTDSRSIAVFALVALAAGCSGTNIDALRSDATPTDAPVISDVITPDVIASDVIASDVIAPDVIVPDVIAPDVIAPDAGTDGGGAFCAAALCGPGTRCCEARRACQPAGVSCPSDPPGACVTNANCASDQFCAGATCGGEGACAARPEACTTEFNPVCGCDGRTYGNACAASSAGVRAASRGECGAVDAGVDAGPAVCATDRDCASGQACCAFTSRCYPAACLGCCMFAPPDAGADAGPAGCGTAAECMRGQECVYATSACATRGECVAAIACLRPETFCSCASVTYMGCRPDRSTRATGACP